MTKLGDKTKAKFQVDSEYCERLRNIRESAGITIKDLCKEIGMGEANYSLVENGTRLPQTESIANYLEYKVRTAVDRLLEDEDLGFYYLSDNKYNKALYYISKGYNVVKASVIVGVDEDVLRKRLRKNGIRFSEFTIY